MIVGPGQGRKRRLFVRCRVPASPSEPATQPAGAESTQPAAETTGEDNTPPAKRCRAETKARFAVPAALRDAAAALSAAYDEGSGKFTREPPAEAVAAVLQHYFGHPSLRPGQREVVDRVAQGQHTLAVLPTGLGKSLCYQLPLLLRLLAAPHKPCFCLVVSPLLSLLKDQLRGLPPGLKGAELSSQLARNEARRAEAKVATGQTQILFVTPERAADSATFHMFLGKVRGSLAYLCVDEAHCLSEWSHNFRPSYLRLRRNLVDRHGLSCVLCLTATAPRHTAADIVRSLRIANPAPSRQTAGSETVTVEGVTVRYNAPRYNLQLSCELVGTTGDAHDRDTAWLTACEKVVTQPPLNEGSIVCYVSTRVEADVVASHLQMKGLSAVSYHSSSAGRANRQDSFIFGETRIVVATIAFGMGIDKSNVRGVVHMMLPNTVEAYMQQIGRAGRDGGEAYCHAILKPDSVLHSMSRAYSGSCSEASVEAVARAAFSCDHPGSGVRHNAIDIPLLSKRIDAPEDVVETLLTLLCLQQPRYIRATGTASGTAVVSMAPAGAASSGRSKSLCTQIAEFGGASDAVRRHVQQVCAGSTTNAGRPKPASLDLLTVSRHLEMPLPDVLERLQQLAEDGIIRLHLRHARWQCELPQPLPPADLGEVVAEVHRRVRLLARMQRDKARVCWTLLSQHLAGGTVDGTPLGHDERRTRSAHVHRLLARYNAQHCDMKSSLFQELLAAPLAPAAHKRAEVLDAIGDAVRADPSFLSSGHRIARVCHGLQSPALEGVAQGHALWRRYMDQDFMWIATEAQRIVDDCTREQSALRRSKKKESVGSAHR